MKGTKLVVLALATVLSAPRILAESYTGGDNNNPFANTNDTSTPTPRANPGDAHFFTSTSTIFDDSAGNSQNGREYKLADATRQANAGQAAATAAGIALTTAAGVQLGLLNFAEAARLFGLAGMEFAQAGRSGGTSAANTGLRDTLLSESGQTSAQSSYNPQQVAQGLMTPEAVAALQAQGIDPNLFFNNLTSGNVRSGSDALAALGQDPSALSPEAQTALNDTGGEDVKSILDQIGLGVNEGAILNSGGGVASNNSAAAHSGARSSANANESSNPSSSANGLAAQNGKLVSRGLGSSATSNGKDGVAGLHSGLEGMFGSFGAGSQEKEMAGGYGGLISRSDLAAMGIVKAKGQTIFKVANRNYHSFLKWRTMRYPKIKQPAAARGIASIP